MVKKERYQSTIGAIYSRNESFFALSAMIFLISLFVGYLHLLDFYLAPLAQQLKRSVAQGDIKLTTLSLFANNIRIMLYIYGGGIFLGVFTAAFLFINGSFLGYFATQAPLGDFIILTAPHGIFEILSLIIAGGAGFRLASFMYKFINGMINETWYGSFLSKIKYVFNEHIEDVKDSLIIMAIAIVLLFIAAVIEANFTLGIYHYITSSV
jgi:uncharacterized membrane protein SpoIIM required for sporulation